LFSPAGGTIRLIVSSPFGCVRVIQRSVSGGHMRGKCDVEYLLSTFHFNYFPLFGSAHPHLFHFPIRVNCWPLFQVYRDVIK
jgi:hypothetical protein